MYVEQFGFWLEVVKFTVDLEEEDRYIVKLSDFNIEDFFSPGDTDLLLFHNGERIGDASLIWAYSAFYVDGKNICRADESSKIKKELKKWIDFHLEVSNEKV